MSPYLPMHLQIVNFDCKNYKVKWGYYYRNFIGNDPLPPFGTI
jgi:hypothetical protein